MKFTVSLADFQQVMQKTLPAIPRKSTLPVLEHLHFSLAENTLSIIATDQDITIMSKLAVEGHSNGTVLVPARKLNDISKALGSAGNFEFNTNEDTFDIKIKTSSGKYSMKGLNPDEYLDLPELFESAKPDLSTIHSEDKSASVELSKDDIRFIANKTVFAVSTDEFRPAMTGVLLEFRGEKLNAVATDSFRLVKAVLRSEKSAFHENLNLIIPARTVELLKKVDDNAILSVIETNDKITHVRFDIGDTVYISRIIDEKFPPYESVIPADNNLIALTSQSEFLAAIKRVAILTSKISNQIRIKLDNNILTITGEDEEQGDSASENLPCDYTGENFEIGFNYKYVEDALNNISGDGEDSKVIITFSESTRPVLLKPEHNSDDLLMLIMPVRL